MWRRRALSPSPDELARIEEVRWTNARQWVLDRVVFAKRRAAQGSVALELAFSTAQGAIWLRDWRMRVERWQGLRGAWWMIDRHHCTQRVLLRWRFGPRWQLVSRSLESWRREQLLATWRARCIRHVKSLLGACKIVRATLLTPGWLRFTQRCQGLVLTERRVHRMQLWLTARELARWRRLTDLQWAALHVMHVQSEVAVRQYKRVHIGMWRRFLQRTHEITELLTVVLLSWWRNERQDVGWRDLREPTGATEPSRFVKFCWLLSVTPPPLAVLLQFVSRKHFVGQETLDIWHANPGEEPALGRTPVTLSDWMVLTD